MARGNSRAQSELPSGFESEIRRGERFNPDRILGKDLSDRAKEFYGFTVDRMNDREFNKAQEKEVGYELHTGDNQIGVGSTLTDEELDEKGVKDPTVRALFKDAEAMKRIGKVFANYRTSEDSWEPGDFETDYAWNGERDVDVGETPTSMSGGVEMIEGDADAITIKYQGKLIDYGPQGEIDLTGEDREYGDFKVDLRDYNLGVFAQASPPSTVKAYESGKSKVVDLDLDSPEPEPKKK
jgi:hypothetical protein